MAIQPLVIPTRIYGEPTKIAPDVNDIVDKINELVDAVNAGLATINAIVGGDKYVQYLSSQTYGVPANALTLDRLDPSTILPGTEATVINPHPTPLTATGPSTYYRATIVPAGTAGTVLVPAFTGSPNKLPITWVEVVSNDTFTPLLASEVNPGKGAYAGLALRPLLIALVNGIGTGSTTVISTPATTQPALGPMVTGFLPASATVGASVTLTGTGFTKATAVLFNGTPASFQAINATTLVAVVPVGATTGPVAVTTSAGTGTSAASFEVKAATTTPTPTPELTAALAISLASLTLGASVSYSVTPAKGTAPYAYEVVATDTSTGQQFTLGTTKTGNWTPTAAGSYAIEATVTDSSSAIQTAESAIRYLQVVQAANRIPVADAGQDVTVQLPTSSVALMGVASDPDSGDTLTYAWRQITGPNATTGLPATSLNVVASGLVAGTYQFGFRSTDNHGAQSVEDFVLVTVQAQGGTPNLGIAYVSMRWGQSNDSGLSPRVSLPAQYTASNSRLKTWNDLTGQIETYQLGVNDNSINSRRWADPNTSDYIVPSYAPSFGAEVGYQYAFLNDGSRAGQTLFTFKVWLGIRNGETVNGNSTTTRIWLDELYPKMKVQWQAFTAALLAAGYSSVQTIDVFCGLGEGNNLAGTQPTYKAELAQLWGQFLSDDLIQASTRKYLMAKQPAQYADILALQKQFIAENPSYTLLTLANPSFLPHGIHYSQSPMLALGALDQGTFTNIAAPAKHAGAQPTLQCWQSRRCQLMDQRRQPQPGRAPAQRR